MSLTPWHTLCLAACISVAVHVAALEGFPLHFAGEGRIAGPVLSATIVSAAPSPNPTATPAPQPDDPMGAPKTQEPPSIEAAGPATLPPSGETPAPAESYPPLSSLSRQPELLTPTNEGDWPRFPGKPAGKFELELIVGTRGRVESITLHCAEALCEIAQAYAAIVRTWIFLPAKLQDQPVPVRLRIEFQVNPPPLDPEDQPSRQ